MVLLLNYLPYLFIALGLYLSIFYFPKKYKGTDKVGKSIVITILATIASWFILAALTASYMPKGTVERIPVPDFTQDPAVETKVENRLLNTAKPKEEAQKDFEAMVDWRAAKAAHVPPEIIDKVVADRIKADARVEEAKKNLAVRQFQLEQERLANPNTETKELPLPQK